MTLSQLCVPTSLATQPLALFEYYEECEEGSGTAIELDPIAICCDWTEYTYAEAVSAYGIDFKDEYFVLEVEEDLYLITG